MARSIRLAASGLRSCLSASAYHSAVATCSSRPNVESSSRAVSSLLTFRDLARLTAPAASETAATAAAAINGLPARRPAINPANTAASEMASQRRAATAARRRTTWRRCLSSSSLSRAGAA
jgi:hypothetical protein